MVYLKIAQQAIAAALEKKGLLEPVDWTEIVKALATVAIAEQLVELNAKMERFLCLTSEKA